LSKQEIDDLFNQAKESSDKLDKAQFISEPIIEFKMRGSDSQKIEKILLRPHESEASNVVYFRKIAEFAQHKINWTKIVN
jgi:hypothetical protein